jgi:hypothetical protein
MKHSNFPEEYQNLLSCSEVMQSRRPPRAMGWWSIGKATASRKRLTSSKKEL